MKFAVTAYSEQIEEAHRLASRLQLPYINPSEANIFDAVLFLTSAHLSLRLKGSNSYQPFYVDFSTGVIHHRMRLANRRNELLARAIGIAPEKCFGLLDATVGFGRDSWLLANLGYKVTALERSPIIFSLLQNGLNRAATIPELQEVCNKLTLIQQDSLHYLKNLTVQNYPDIIYLDPMFPPRRKKALVKKEMILLQNLVGQDIDADTLLSLALDCARKRVVVKRAKLAPNIAEFVPNFTLTGKVGRFDVYLR